MRLYKPYNLSDPLTISLQTYNELEGAQSTIKRKTQGLLLSMRKL